ncbi:NAD(P)H-dependent oxidoreductase [Falsochrobactrum sp. TDYN1]|uniref:NAD(P)H-dependent oxidoreductase n=1 Tax=Falsochrobactrum tianjinense TaxID=2706015 RepID=A0A949PJP8_9HYPH|nr:NAD(P)H-dependent oxidoreductase [Falsochrobactrum sp. TDYN1]MBV2142087.1 NAD(P)H-dependent oxidoreductase [Falsochrobactrum sp. TDYN1]
MTAHILVFAGSIRKGAYSGHMADAASKELVSQGAEVTRITLADFPLPIMDEDLEKEHGIPENALRLGRLFAAHDGLMICSPEYNASIPPLLKNTIDWVSRISRDGDKPFKPYAGLTVGLCSTSNGNFAGLRGLYHLRAVLMNVGTQIVTEQCSVARASEAFNDDATLKDERSARMLSTVCRSLIERVEASRG